MRMRRLVCACVVRKPRKTGFLASRPMLYVPKLHVYITIHYYKVFWSSLGIGILNLNLKDQGTIKPRINPSPANIFCPEKAVYLFRLLHNLNALLTALSWMQTLGTLIRLLQLSYGSSLIEVCTVCNIGHYRTDDNCREWRENGLKECIL